MKKATLIREHEKQRGLEFIRISAPIVAALIIFLTSAFYIIYRMVTDYNYYERWKDYEECGMS